jgi:putative ABC transport system permease protein
MCMQGMHLDMSLALAIPSLATLAYMLVIIIRPPLWWAPQYMVPLCGMALGNGLNGVTVGVKAFLEAVSAERHAIEWALAMGATRFEATWCAPCEAQPPGAPPAVAPPALPCRYCELRRPCIPVISTSLSLRLFAARSF